MRCHITCARVGVIHSVVFGGFSAEALADRGFYVIRMGKKVNAAINSSQPNVIDYATNGMRSDFMDIYLGAKCSFCISSNFGPLNLFEIFGKLNAQVSVPFASSHTIVAFST